MARRARRPFAGEHVSTEAVVSAIKESGSNRTPLRIAGRSTWLDAGRPVRADKTLSLRDDSGVVSYVPGDLTLTVRAGTTLDEIGRVTGEHDQWLPLDPYGSNDGTIGATIATASAGPLASSFGFPRDLLLGLEFVNGRGDVVRGGGKVVKNVAGFDLSRLLTGSWGTLGVITEVTLRLYARPKVDRTFVVKLRGTEKQVTGLLRAFRGAPIAPFAMELLNATSARALSLDDNPVCLIRLGGNAAAVDAQIKAIATVVKVDEVADAMWSQLRNLENGADDTIRIAALPVQFVATSAAMLKDEMPGIFSYVNIHRGVMRIFTSPQALTVAAGIPDGRTSVDLRVSSENPGEGVVVYEKLPAEVWPIVSPTVISDSLSQGIKKAYDPHGILNPGILGD
jgi:glycolate oxidase FAD binding subunit